MSRWVRYGGPVLVGALVPALVAGDFIATVMGLVLPTPWYILVAVGLSGLAFLAMSSNGWRAAVCGSIAMLALAALLFYWPLTPRKQFVRSFQRLRIGMSAQQVSSLMGRYRKGHPYGYVFGSRPNKELWHHGKGGSLLSFDHCVVNYADGRVRDFKLILD